MLLGLKHFKTIASLLNTFCLSPNPTEPHPPHPPTQGQNYEFCAMTEHVPGILLLLHWQRCCKFQFSQKRLKPAEEKQFDQLLGARSNQKLVQIHNKMIQEVVNQDLFKTGWTFFSILIHCAPPPFPPNTSPSHSFTLFLNSGIKHLSTRVVGKQHISAKNNSSKKKLISQRADPKVISF